MRYVSFVLPLALTGCFSPQAEMCIRNGVEYKEPGISQCADDPVAYLYCKDVTSLQSINPEGDPELFKECYSDYPVFKANVDRFMDESRCDMYGFAEGSNEFAMCRMKLASDREAAEQNQQAIDAMKRPRKCYNYDDTVKCY